jgi:hypothetical protein
MRLVLSAFMIAAGLALAIPSQARPAKPGEAWFYSTTSLRAPADAPITWCSFVTDASAKAAARSDRFEPVESGWLRYRGDSIVSLMIITQSEDSYLEDSYKFGPGLGVMEVVRKGHYSTDPFVTARFRPDAGGHLKMTAESRRALRSWKRLTYFLEWPLYAKFSEIPFAGLIRIKPSITVEPACQRS